MINPLLSICIPTYNRAELLKSLLLSLNPQVKELAEEVELIISDNCSTDQTHEIVQWAQQHCPIQYQRNQKNIGAVGNIHLLVESLAKGQFCWILGDDELIRPGGVREIVKILKTKQNVDYIYVNYLYIKNDSCTNKGISNLTESLPLGTIAGSNKLTPYKYEHWEDLVPDDFNCLTAMYCSVFRRQLWLEKVTKNNSALPYSSIETTYPHAVILAKAMKGRSAYSTGYPWIVSGGGKTITWKEYWPVICLMRFNEYLDFLIKLGVDSARVKVHRCNVIKWSEINFHNLIKGNKYPYLESFSFLRYLIKYGKYSAVRQGIYNALRWTSLKSFGRSYWGWMIIAFFIKCFAKCYQFAQSCPKFFKYLVKGDPS